MKKLLMPIIVFALLLASCGDSKKEEVKKDAETKVEKVVEEVKDNATAVADQGTLGEKLFTEKTCVSCHQLDTKLIGPSIKEIIKIYDEKNGNLVQFMKGNDAPIVDTDPGQVAIMKANLDGFVKDLSAEELQALAAYMRNAK